MSRKTPTQCEPAYAQLLAVGVPEAAAERFAPVAVSGDGDLEVNGRDIFLTGPIVDDGDKAWLARGGMASVSPQAFRTALAAVADGSGDRPRLRINSPGGSVFATAAIKAVLDEAGAYDARVDGQAASAAGILAIGAAHTEMAELSALMLHGARVGVFGTAADLRRGADVIDQLDGVQAKILGRRGIGADDARAILAAETWYSAETAVEAGLADTVLGPEAPAEEGGGAPTAAAEAFRARMRARARATEG